MKTIYKELMCLATSYLDMYCNENNTDKEVTELYEFCRREVFFTIAKGNQNIAINYTDSICAKMSLATAGRELEANVLTLAISSLQPLVDNDVYKLSKGMQLKRLVNNIYKKLEQAHQEKIEFNNSIKLICSIIDREIL